MRETSTLCRMEISERTTDQERRRAAADVEAAVGDGLLDLAEAEERLGRVWASRTTTDLQLVRADLPTAWLDARRRHEAALEAHEQARRALPAHVGSWLKLVTLLVVIWALTTPGGYLWPIWPAFGTGICLAGRVASAHRPVSS